MNGVGFGRKYELEAKLMEREEDKTLQYNSFEQFLEIDFKGKSSHMSKKIERFYVSIEFLSKSLKKRSLTEKLRLDRLLPGSIQPELSKVIKIRVP